MPLLTVCLRSPSGSHSTPSPLSQPELAEPGDHHGYPDLKRPHPDTGLHHHHHHQPQQSAAAVKKPKPSRRKKKRDPNEPQKPVSAYALFFRDRQASIKGRNPNMSFGEVSKMVAGLWDGLDAEAKSHYKKRTEIAKKEYLRQLAAYRASSLSAAGAGAGHEAGDLYGGGGYLGGHGGYPAAAGDGHLEAGVGMGQNIPPHPLPHPPPHPAHHQLGAATFVTNSKDYLNQQHQVRHSSSNMWKNEVYHIFLSSCLSCLLNIVTNERTTNIRTYRSASHTTCIRPRWNSSRLYFLPSDSDRCLI